MEQLNLNLDDTTRDKLRALAAEHGRSEEEEVHEIVRGAVMKATRNMKVGLGTRIASYFKDCKLAEGELEEFRGQPARPATFDS